MSNSGRPKASSISISIGISIGNISAAWAVDREFVNILALTGEVSNIFWLDFGLVWHSGVCSGLFMDSLKRI